MKLLEKLRMEEGLQAAMALAAVLGCGMLLPSAVQADDVVIEGQRSLAARTAGKCDWHMISLNCQPDNNTIYELYSDDHTGKYCYPDEPDSKPDPRTGYPRKGEDYMNAQWAVWADIDDPDNHAGATVDDTILLGPDHPLKQGEGYWICVTDNPLTTLDVCDNNNDKDKRATTEPCKDYGYIVEDNNGNILEDARCAVIDVKKTPDNLDMIGHPFSFTVRWKDHVKVACNIGETWTVIGSPKDADESGILSQYYFTYNANGYDTYSEDAGVLEPQTGYWLRTLDNYKSKCPGPEGVKLLIQDHQWEGNNGGCGS